MLVEKTKVIAYILHQDRLLVFCHTQFPEAGIQVPAGTVEPGEALDVAVLREAREETGLQGLRLVAYLGAQDIDVSPWGKAQIHHRHFFHLELDPLAPQPPESWLNYEEHPSEDGPGPFEFEFFWVPFPEGVPDLIARQGELLQQLHHS